MSPYVNELMVSRHCAGDERKVVCIGDSGQRGTDLTMRRALCVVHSISTGLVVAIVLAMAVEFVSAGSESAMCEHVKLYTQWVLPLVSVSWAATIVVSCWLAKRIDECPHGLPVRFPIGGNPQTKSQWSDARR